ncbi:Ribonuclease H-like superfamily protein [Prunus dulcis]|uniref:Ribonuclease H-like superfamily protein n=1 Tax=Prunus dulcis TaxID=3755 RepID=A0A5H2XFT9_PRUDU|nr:Ribonuclease H-like superfamily protein [Prunus dulcis]
MKGCSRLLTEPNSLWAHLLKARYFPECNFMEATKGSRASWAWASLIEGRKVILNGARWLIMNGAQARIWTDKWITNNSRTWKLDLIRPLLSTEEAFAIQRIPIGSSSEVDRLVWLDEKNGKYSVVFDNFTPQPQQTLKAIFDQVNERFSLKHLITSSTTRSVHPSAQASWAAPSEPFVKINVDAAWRKSTCHAGASIVIRNFEGRFLGAKSVDFQVENALIAEATALWEGCKFAKERGHNMVCFESDSLELIKVFVALLVEGVGLCTQFLPSSAMSNDMLKSAGGIGPPEIVIKRRIILRRWHYRGVRKFGLNGPPPLLCTSFARMDSLVLTMPNLVFPFKKGEKIVLRKVVKN